MKFFAFCFFAILIHPICAQSIAEELYDTAKRIDPVSVSQDGFLRNSKYDQRLDSSLLYFQQYDRTKKNNIAIQNLGDVHTPFLDLQFRPFDKTGVVAGMNPFQNLYYSIEQARFYNTPLPYTEFQYAQGKGGRRGMICRFRCHAHAKLWQKIQSRSALPQQLQRWILQQAKFILQKFIVKLLLQKRIATLCRYIYFHLEQNQFS